MKIITTEIEDVKIMEPRLFGDERGFFMETWRDDQFKELVSDSSFVQDNHSKSSRGILRGLHYQVKHSQGKLVRVISGEVFDVAVDIRKGSLTFGSWVGVVLSSENRRMLWVPPGFAHGFYVMGDGAEFLYKCTDYYAPQYERSIMWNDPLLSIQWPLADGKPPILSAKDENGCSFENCEPY